MKGKEVCVCCGWDIENMDEAFGVNDGYVCDSSCLADLIDMHGILVLKQGTA
jgi:hypothetical protein